VYETISENNKNSNFYESAKRGPQVSTQPIDYISRYPAQHATPYIKTIRTTVPQGIKTFSDYSTQTSSHNMRSYSSATNDSISEDPVIPKSTTIASQMCVVG
jgi:hypothetical protein